MTYQEFSIVKIWLRGIYSKLNSVNVDDNTEIAHACASLNFERKISLSIVID